jgi:peroxiredoxin
MKRFTISLSVIIALFFFVASAYALDNGSKVPNFTLTDLSGKNVSLSDYKGKVVVLNFWASWCPPCKAEMPEFNEMDREFKKSGDTVLLAINMTDGRRETKKKVETFISEQKYKMRVLLDSEGKASNLFDIRYLPTTYVIDAEGTVTGQLVGGTTKNAVMKLVKEAK